MGNKESACTTAGVTSGVLGAIGVGLLCVATGGVGAVVVGGVLFGTGVAGTVNSIQQACNDKDEFSFGSFALDTTLGAATSLATGGIGVGANAVV